MSDAPVLIVSGYLGAGKTTYINHLLTTAGPGVWVLVNDFGSVNVDASLIKNASGTTLELTNGCICCAFDDDLAGMLRTVRDSVPERVIIETSGVADPATLVPHTMTPGFSPGGIVVVVDGERLPALVRDRLVGRTVTRQIAAADVILVTRTGVTDDISAAVRLHNPDAVITDDPEHGVTIRHAQGRLGSAGAHENPHTETTLHPELSTVNDALRWLSELDASVVRAKGIAVLENGTYLVERVGTTATVTPADATPTDGIVVIRVA